MEIGYHRLVARDVAEVVDHYRSISEPLADQFLIELRGVIQRAAESPLRFHPAGRYRRANLSRFPYHVLFEIRENVLRVMLVRHHKRHPRYGVSRT